MKEPARTLHASLDSTWPDGISSVLIIGPEDQRQRLKIRFKRTIKVSGDQHSSCLPPHLGNFPLFNIDDFLGFVRV